MRNLSFLIILLCTAGFWGGVIKAFAHTDTPHVGSDLKATVGDVQSGSASLEDLVKHAAVHLSEATSFGEALPLLNEFRDRSGDWNDGSTYLILLTRGGGVYIHPKDRQLEDQDWSELLSGCSGESWNDLVAAGGGCVKERDEGDEGYAVSFSAPYVPFANPKSEKENFVLIGGLDYAPEIDEPASFEEMVDDLVDSYVSRLLGSDIDLKDIEESEQYMKQRMEFRDAFFTLVSPEIDSSEVSGEEDLKRFLDEAYTFMTSSFSVDLFDPVILRRVFRFEGGPWRNLSTYIYILDDNGNSIFSGATRNNEQTNALRDHGPEVAQITQSILDAAQMRSESGSFVGGFVNYDWDDPAVIGDERDGPGGSSPKLAFVKAFTVAVDKDRSVDNPRTYIFGTGLYLEPEDDGGGCAVAGAESSLGNAVANLFLVVSGIFSLLLFRRKRR